MSQPGDGTDGAGTGLPREERLRRRREYRRVYDGGRRAAGSLLVVFELPNAEGRVRLGITATRRVGSAVVRNRVRRRIREAYRRLKPSLPRCGGHDVVVNARDRAASCDAAALSAELARLLGRLLGGR